MDLFITSERGLLVQNGEIIDSPSLFTPKGEYVDGNLYTAASLKNIQSVCESLLEYFIRPQGMSLWSDPKWEGYITLDVGKKYQNGDNPPVRSDNNLTRGWCYLVSGVLHRFFYKNYDLYKVPCVLDPKKRDFHWWLESKCRNYVIDLTEEQYLINGIKNIRDGVLRKPKSGEIKPQRPLRTSYAIKTKNMSYFLFKYFTPYDVPMTRIKQHMSLIQI